MRTEVGDELPACPALGTDGAGTSPGPLPARLRSAQGLLPQTLCLIAHLGAGLGPHWKLVILPAITADFVKLHSKQEVKIEVFKTTRIFCLIEQRTAFSFQGGELASRHLVSPRHLTFAALQTKTLANFHLVRHCLETTEEVGYVGGVLVKYLNWRVATELKAPFPQSP